MTIRSHDKQPPFSPPPGTSGSTGKFCGTLLFFLKITNLNVQHAMGKRETLKNRWTGVIMDKNNSIGCLDQMAPVPIDQYFNRTSSSHKEMIRGICNILRIVFKTV